MKTLNNYITEAWAGVKQQANNANIEAWCDEIGIQNYTINSKGEIDVSGYVNLREKDFKELPYKFGMVDGRFSLSGCKNLISLKNCPDKVRGYFACNYCKNLKSLEGCPIYVGWDFYCGKCKRKFSKKEVKTLCEVKGDILI